MTNTFRCRLCKTAVPVLKDSVEEHQLDLIEGPEKTHQVQATFFTCPRCGKTYPVLVDDEITLPLLNESIEVEKRFQKYKSQNRPVPERLRKKHRLLHNKLDFKRHQLALEYGSSFYQLEDGTFTQLDYCYHAQ